MKTILLKLRKCLCLTLSIFLLASNMQVFAQEAPGFDSFQNMKTNLESLKKAFEEMKAFYNNPQNSFEGILEGLEGCEDKSSFYETAENFERQYADIRASYLRYRDHYISSTDKEIMEILQKKYSVNSAEELLNILPTQTEEKMILSKLLPEERIKLSTNATFALVDEAYDFTLKKGYAAMYTDHALALEWYFAWIEKKDVTKINEYLDYYKNKLEEMSKSFTEMTNEIVRKNITPEDVLEYAYKNDMLPKEKAGVKLTLEAMDADVSVNSLVKSIRKYLTDFGTKVKDVKYYPEESLMRELEGMTLAERTKYVDELTELQSGSKEFIKDFNKLDRPAKRYISKNITGGAWVSVGLVVGLTLLFELIPQNSNANNINKSLEIMDTLDDISYKIENGEATMAEMLYFYTIPENEYLILKDPVHTLNFVKLAQGAMEAEEILEAEKENKAKENKAIENSILKNYQKQASKTDFGVGTL